MVRFVHVAVVTLFVGSFFLLPQYAQGEGTQGEISIPSFDARVTVHDNATIEVSERIVYDFGTTEKHGIKRLVQYSYQSGTETYTAEISSVFVDDEFGNPLPFSESRGNGELTLIIGNPDATVSGVQTYVISYIVTGPFLYYEDYDEFYWNVSGSWARSIGEASVLVDLPRGARVLSASCYKGSHGNEVGCDSDERLVSTERAGYTAEALNLAGNEGFAVSVLFPKGVIREVQKPWEKKEPLNPFDLWPFLIPLYVAVHMGYRWYTSGRDPKGRGVVVTELAPPLGLSPAVCGVVLREKVDSAMITAEILRLAVEGYIKIHAFETEKLFYIETDYILERIGEKVPEDVVGAVVLEKLFKLDFFGEALIEGKKIEGTLVSRLHSNFVKERGQIMEVAYEEVVYEGFFLKRPDKVRIQYVFSGVLVSAVGFFLSFYFGKTAFMFVGPAVILSGSIVFVVGLCMPVKTKEGVQVREHLEGFKRYLEVAEKDRIEFHDAPTQTPITPSRTIELFSEYLPYAIVFGVEKGWIEQYRGVFYDGVKKGPDWYSGNEQWESDFEKLAIGVLTVATVVKAVISPLVKRYTERVETTVLEEETMTKEMKQ